MLGKLTFLIYRGGRMGKTWFAALAEFHGMNISTLASFKLPTQMSLNSRRKKFNISSCKISTSHTPAHQWKEAEFDEHKEKQKHSQHAASKWVIRNQKKELRDQEFSKGLLPKITTRPKVRTRFQYPVLARKFPWSHLGFTFFKRGFGQIIPTCGDARTEKDNKHETQHCDST